MSTRTTSNVIDAAPAGRSVQDHQRRCAYLLDWIRLELRLHGCHRRQQGQRAERPQQTLAGVESFLNGALRRLSGFDERLVQEVLSDGQQPRGEA